MPSGRFGKRSRVPVIADEAFYAVVIGCDVLVIDRPIVSRAIEAAGLEVVRRKTERLASPNVGSPADETRAIPVELLPSCHRVWLARQIRASQVGPELAAAELLLELSPLAEPTIPQLIRPNMFTVVASTDRRAGPLRAAQPSAPSESARKPQYHLPLRNRQCRRQKSQT